MTSKFNELGLGVEPMARHSQIGVFNRLAIPPGRTQILWKEKRETFQIFSFSQNGFQEWKPDAEKCPFTPTWVFKNKKNRLEFGIFQEKKLTGQEDEANHFITAQKSQPCNLVIHYSLKA